MKWLWELNGQKCGGVIADEMGLGKVSEERERKEEMNTEMNVLDNTNHCFSRCIPLQSSTRSSESVRELILFICRERILFME